MTQLSVSYQANMKNLSVSGCRLFCYGFGFLEFIRSLGHYNEFWVLFMERLTSSQGVVICKCSYIGMLCVIFVVDLCCVIAV